MRSIWSFASVGRLVRAGVISGIAGTFVVVPVYGSDAQRVRDHRTPTVQVATFDCEKFRERYRPAMGNFVAAAWVSLGAGPLIGSRLCTVSNPPGSDCRLTAVPKQIYDKAPVRFMFNVQGQCARFDVPSHQAIRRDGPGYSTYQVDLDRRSPGTVTWVLVITSGPGAGGEIGNSLKVVFTAPKVTGGM